MRRDSLPFPLRSDGAAPPAAVSLPAAEAVRQTRSASANTPLSGSLVLITGASSGIGRAAARAFVREGSRVVAVARDGDRLDALSAELGGPAYLLPIRADVTDEDSMSSMSARVFEIAGLPHVVVANAGVGLDALFVETSDEALRELFEVNFFGVVRTIRPFLPQMIERGSGRVLIVSSIVGKRGIPHYSGYSASKFALHGLADALRSELYGTGVTVGLVCPSSTESEFHDRAVHAGPRQRRARPRRHSAESVARSLVRMARSRRPELLLSAESRLLSWADSVAPRLVDRLLSRVLMRRG